jgi:hypothetical protein
VDKAKDKARLATRLPAYYAGQVAKIADPQFMKAIRDYRDKTEDLYKELSSTSAAPPSHRPRRSHRRGHARLRYRR